MAAILFVAVTVGALPPISWSDLVTDYRDLGLPEPTANAMIIFAGGGSGSVSGESFESFRFAIAVGEGKRIRLLGEREPMDEQERSSWKVLQPTREAIEDLRRRVGKHGTMEADALFPIQATMLGRGDIATLVKEDPRHTSVFGRPLERLPNDPRRRLAVLAWRQWQRAFATERGDRRPVVSRLEQMLAPKWGIGSPARRTLVSDMKKTLEPRPVPADPHHAAIERLLDLRLGAYHWPDARREPRFQWRSYGVDRDEDERCQALLRAGLDAVPALLEHRDDFRVTRSLYEYRREISTRNIRVADVVLMLLSRMAPGEDFAYASHDRTGRGAAVDQAQVLDWLGRVRANGERDAFLAAVFVKGAKDGSEPVQLDQLRVVAEKYPSDFPALFRRAVKLTIKTPYAADVFVVARESKLPAAEKISLLKEAVEATTGVSSAEAAVTLAMTDRNAGLTVFEAQLADVDLHDYKLHVLVLGVAELDDPRYWAALENAARRLSPEGRVGILSGLAARSKNLAAIPFWSTFLDDDSQGTYSGPCSSGQRITYVVRDLAAERIARAWDWDAVEPKDAAARDELRRKVRAELERRKGAAK